MAVCFYNHPKLSRGILFAGGVRRHRRRLYISGFKTGCASTCAPDIFAARAAHPWLASFSYCFIEGSPQNLMFQIVFLYCNTRMVKIQLSLLFYRRKASEPYILKSPCIKQNKSGPDPHRWGAPSALGSILGCAPGMRRALFWSRFPEVAEEP